MDIDIVMQVINIIGVMAILHIYIYIYIFFLHVYLFLMHRFSDMQDLNCNPA